MISIIIPTYEEKGNIPKLCTRISDSLSEKGIKYEIIFIDDNSQDGTIEEIKEAQKSYPIRLIVRKSEKGLSSAVVEGFKNASFETLCVMDADLSHPPEKIPEMFEEIKNGNADFVIGSRFIKGGGTSDWNPIRKLVSFVARIYAKLLTDVKDSTSGFFMIKKSVLENVTLKPKGFKICLELIMKGKYSSIEEIPIVFTEREHSKSKMGLKQIVEYRMQIVEYLFLYRKAYLFGGIAFLSAIMFKLWAINLFPITSDESYYWLWSKHLSLSYVDHPPLIAYINKFSSFLFNDSLFGIRLTGILISIIISITAYYLGKEVFNKKTGFVSAVLIQLIPHYLIVWLNMTLEIPLVLFWSLSTLFFVKSIKTNKNIYWALLSLSLGFGILTKYTMFLIYPLFACFLISSKIRSGLLKEKKLYFSLLASLLFFAPVFIWNAQNAFISFGFHSSRIDAPLSLSRFAGFIGEEIIHVNPFIFFGFFPAIIFAIKKHKSGFSPLIALLSAPVFMLFALLSIRTTVYAHWPAVSFFAMAIIFSYYALSNNKKWLFYSVFAFDILLISVLLFISPGILKNQENYKQNYLLKEKINIISPKAIMCDNYALASEISFYSKQKVYYETLFPESKEAWGYRQFQKWGKVDPQIKDKILFATKGSNENILALKKKYSSVKRLDSLKIYPMETWLEDTAFFECEEKI